MALRGIEPGPDWFSEEQIRGDAAMRLMARIELRPDMGKPDPDSHHVARAQLSLKDGRIFHAEVKSRKSAAQIFFGREVYQAG